MGSSNPLDLVTGAFGNTGSVITRSLLAGGRQVRTLTSHAPDEVPDGVEVFEWHDLAAAFEGVSTFYNTFWMRTGNPGSAGTDYSQAVARSTALIEAAAAAGVERIVHLSVARADDPAAAGYPYFAAKAHVEGVLRSTGVAHTIVRPALIFGGGPGMVEQLALVLRRSPVMGVAGNGRYRVRPVHVDDVATLCLAHTDGVTDAVGPDRPTFEELARAVAAALGKRRLFLHLPTAMVVAAGRALGKLVRQELITGDELRSTMDGLADTDGPATGTVGVLDWIATEMTSCV
ncbi:MAG TPA: NAD(P)H-binding protein [Ilumatobacter sp.]|nr:NAD(P)H-binding protein [Ilumatobacter sp.]